MILDELILHNFGLYADRQAVALTPPSPAKPIILFGGLNGGGKTTLLDALQLCLFGPQATISNRGPLGYHEYLSRSIHRQSRVREAALEVAFRHTIDGQEDCYRLHRSWRVNNQGCKEHFEVLKNGRPEPALAENWLGQVDEFLPPSIAHLFLFDGEQIEAYASKDNSAALIASAIQNLLGLDIVDQLERDLSVYERRKRSEEKSDVKADEIAAADASVAELHKRIEQLRQDQASLKTHQLDRKRKALAVAEESYRKLGGELYDQRQKIEEAAADAARVIETGAKNLREFAAGAAPLALVRPLLDAVRMRDDSEEESRRARDVMDTLKRRDAALLKHLRDGAASARVLDILKSFLEQDRRERRAAARAASRLDLPPETRAELSLLLRESLDEAIQEGCEALSRQRGAANDAARLRLRLESIPRPDTLAQAIARREALQGELTALEAEYADRAEDIERLTRELDRAQQNLSRLLEGEAEAQFARDDRKRTLHHAARVRSTLKAFHEAVVARHIGRIEKLVLESYLQLLRKSALVTRLALDPQSFALDLYGRDGGLLSPERLSAGERQLLAIALLWGLAKASGRPIPTAIDTPLGRLDTSHRMHLVERYFPFASHQVLLLSTDEEITGPYLERLRPWIGRSYALAYDDDSGSTRIVPGYFEDREAA